MAHTAKNSRSQPPRQASAPSARKNGARQRVGKPDADCLKRVAALREEMDWELFVTCRGPYSAKPPKGSAKRGLDVLSTTDTELVSWVPSPGGGKSLKRRPFEVDDIRLGALHARALADGAPVDPNYGPQWDVSGKGKYKCTSPRSVELTKDLRDAPVSVPNPTKWSKVQLMTRCRRCENCLKARSALWKLRAIAEVERHMRSWFVTLTFGPEERTRADYAAGLRLDRRRSDVTPENLFRERQRYLGPHVTRWLKRVRKGHAKHGEKPAGLRYLLVVEAHKDGFPHYHLIVHEQSLGEITKRRLQRNWTAGWSNARLVGVPLPTDKEGMDDAQRVHRDAAYTCKYIAKSALSRIRASSQYGVN